MQDTHKSFSVGEAWSLGWTLASLALPLAVAAGLWLGGAWAWAVPVVLLVVVPTLDRGLRALPAALLQTHGATPAALVPVYSAVQILFTGLAIPTFGLLLWRLDTQGLTADTLGGAASFALLSGIVLANAHDLMHRMSPTERAVGVAIQRFYFFPADFVVEHLQRHHSARWLCLPEDVEAAAKDMSFYAFVRRAVFEGNVVKKEVEEKRLARKGLPWKGWHNRLQRSKAARLVLLTALFASVSWWVALLALVILFAGTMMFTASGYLQHYGISRQVGANGRPEPVTLALTWDRNDPIGKHLFFAGTRHPIHHLKPNMPYWDQLRQPTARYELPHDYLTMYALALVPPLFFRVMHAHMRAVGLLQRGNVVKKSA